MIQPYLEYAQNLLSTGIGNTWMWFATLTREEWFVVLAAVSAAGFLCMRGFGSRNSY